MTLGQECLVDELLCLHALVGEDQLSHLLQRFECLGVVVAIGAASPEGALVELYLVAGHAAIDHRSHAAVAQWQCLGPRCGRTMVTQ